MPIARISRAVLLVAIATASTAQCQATADDRELVRRAVLAYVEGFYEGDSAKLVASVHPEVAKLGFWISRDSTRYQSERMPWPEFHAYANRVQAAKRFAPADARRDIAVFDVLD